MYNNDEIQKKVISKYKIIIYTIIYIYIYYYDT